MSKIYLFIKRRWLVFLVVSIALYLFMFKITSGRQDQYRAEARIIFIGSEGSFSPELEARRIRDKDFLAQAVSRLSQYGHGTDYVLDNLELDFERYEVLSVSFVSEDPHAAKDIVSVISGLFVHERKNRVDELDRAKKGRLQLLSDDILELESKLSIAERNLRESKQKNMVSDQRRAELQAAIDDSTIEYKQLLTTFTERHPNVINLKNKLDLLSSQLDSLFDTDLEYKNLEVIIASENIQLAARRKEYQSLYDQVQGQPSPWQAEIGKEATVPEAPVGINKQAYYLWSVVISMSVAFLICILIEFSDNRIHTASEAENRLGVPVIADIGNVPVLKVPPRKKTAKTKTRVQGISPAARKVEQLCTHLKIETFKGSMAGKIILVTGPDIRTGKSFIAYNLALACARNGENVLLVDANLQYPAFNMFFNLESNTKGFSDLIRGSVKPKESVKNITDLLLSGTLNLRDGHSRGLDHLKILLAGSSIENPACILESDKMKKTLKELSAEYGTLIIDSPNLKSFPSALNLASAADFVLLAAAKHKTKYPVMKEAVKKILAIKSTGINMVLAHV